MKSLKMTIAWMILFFFTTMNYSPAQDTDKATQRQDNQTGMAMSVNPNRSAAPVCDGTAKGRINANGNNKGQGPRDGSGYGTKARRAMGSLGNSGVCNPGQQTTQQRGPFGRGRNNQK